MRQCKALVREEQSKLIREETERREEKMKTLKKKGSVAGGLASDLEEDYAVGVVLGEGGFGLVR